jgi:hypothetical protein
MRESGEALVATIGINKGMKGRFLDARSNGRCSGQAIQGLRMLRIPS